MLAIEGFHNSYPAPDQLAHNGQLEKLNRNFKNHSKDIGKLWLRRRKSLRSQREGKQEVMSLRFCAAFPPTHLLAHGLAGVSLFFLSHSVAQGSQGMFFSWQWQKHENSEGKEGLSNKNGQALSTINVY